MAGIECDEDRRGVGCSRPDAERLSASARLVVCSNGSFVKIEDSVGGLFLAA
jgi:hypothetical protein